MTLTSKHWLLMSLASAALLIALAVFGGGYRALGTLFLSLGLWFGLRREPEESQTRPAIRLVGWIFVAVAAAAILASAFAIAGGK